MSAGDEDIEDSSAPLIEHLAELRTRLIRSVLALFVGICVLFIPFQGDFLAEHVLPPGLRRVDTGSRRWVHTSALGV